MPTQALERKRRKSSRPDHLAGIHIHVRQSPLQNTLTRTVQAVHTILNQAGGATIDVIQISSNEAELLVKTAQVAAKNIPLVSPTEQKLNDARVRGLDRIVELRRAAEPVLETGQVCELLGVSRETIRKKVDRRQLLALPKGGDRVFPAFQFKDGAVLNGFSEVLEALDTDSVFTILAFLLSTNPDFDNKTALQLLQDGEFELVLTEARGFLKHGA
jgi:hypothetical protein